jgi:pyrophosphatase PpaX
LADQLRHFSGWDDVEPLLQSYRAYNVQHHDTLARMFPYVAEVLRTLHVGGYRIGVVTTKMRASTDRSLRFFGVDRFIQTIVSVEEVEHVKPHPEPVLLALARLHALPERAVMVGDSPVDLLAAQAAGVQAFGVAWSLKGATELRRYPPVTILESMADLLPCIGLAEGVRKY